MVINDINIETKDGYYSSRDIHRASGKNVGYRPEVFIDTPVAKTIADSTFKDGSGHILITSGSNPKTYFSPPLSMAYAAWLGEIINEFSLCFAKDNHDMGYIEGSCFKDNNLRNEIIKEGYDNAYKDYRNELEIFISELPPHPVQNKNISSNDLWASAFTEPGTAPQDFLKQLLLRAGSYRNMGREDMLSEYDWGNNCYWMTPEFAFSITSFFPDGSIEQLKMLGFIKEITGGRVWASSIKDTL